MHDFLAIEPRFFWLKDEEVFDDPRPEVLIAKTSDRGSKESIFKHSRFAQNQENETPNWVNMIVLYVIETVIGAKIT